jgi:DNA-3-methyladenine glycosylase II
MSEYFEHLKRDKKLGGILTERLLPVKPGKEPAMDLIQSIASQQLSVKAAETIFDRFKALMERNPYDYERIAQMNPDLLRKVGFSFQKANYIKNVALFHLREGIHTKHLKKLSNDEIIQYLTQIKGVGKWTVEMLMIFSLGREDVFSNGDLGIQQAMKKLYRIKDNDKKRFLARMDAISEVWRPYRSYACRHLWRFKDVT